jgi:hypothetical protein
MIAIGWAYLARVAAAVVFDLPAGARTARAARSHLRHQGRRAARPTARGRRAAPHHPETPPELGRPSRLRRARPSAAPSTASPSPGHPRHDLALASPSHPQEVDLSEPARTTNDRRQDHRADRADRDGKRKLGIPEDPGRAAQARPPGRRLHHPADPEAPPDPTRPGFGTPTPAGGSSCAPRPPACSRSTSSTSTAR